MDGRLLRTVRANFQGLPWVEERWARARQEGREDSDELLVDSISFRDEWRDLMAILAELHRGYQRGSLPVEHERQYEALLAIIRERLPMVERLGLELPPPTILDHLAKIGTPPSTAPR